MTSRLANLLWTAALTALILLSIPVCYELFYLQVKQQRLLAFAENASQVRVSDFISFYNPGRMALSSDRFQVYDPLVQRRWTNELIAPLKIDKVFYHQGVPFLFPLMAPLALLPVLPAYVLWCVAGVLFGSAMIWLFLSRFTSWDGRRKLACCLLTAWSTPSLFGLQHGQIEWFLLGFVTLYFYGFFAQRDVLAGVALAFSTLKPQYALILAAPALGLKRWKLLAAATVAELALLALAAATIGWRNVVFYPLLLQKAEVSPMFAGVWPEAMACMRLPLTAVFGPYTGFLLALLLHLAAAAVLLFLWWRSSGTTVAQRRWLAALTVLCALIYSPHTHTFDLVLIALCVLLTGDEPLWNPTAQRFGWRRAWFVMLYGYPLFAWLLFNALNALPLPLLIFNSLLLGVGALIYAGELKALV